MKWYPAEKIGTSIEVREVDFLSLFEDILSYNEYTGIILSIKEFNPTNGYQYIVLAGDKKIIVESSNGKFIHWGYGECNL